MRKIYGLLFFFLTGSAFAQMPLDSASLAEQPEFSDLESLKIIEIVENKEFQLFRLSMNEEDKYGI